jgi:hypothetical protein
VFSHISNLEFKGEPDYDLIIGSFQAILNTMTTRKHAFDWEAPGQNSKDGGNPKKQIN